MPRRDDDKEALQYLYHGPRPGGLSPAGGYMALTVVGWGQRKKITRADIPEAWSQKRWTYS